MPWPKFFSGKSAADKEADRLARAAADQRGEEWGRALGSDRLPAFVEARLRDARDGKTPWISTLTPAELHLAVKRGVRPIATVSGTCWYHYGQSWTEGHSAGWRSALRRIKAEALACGASAVVDVKMRTIHHTLGGDMDFTLVGTAIKVDGLAPSRDPIIATAPMLDFIRLLQAGVVPVGLAVGARYGWLSDPMKTFGGTLFSNRELQALNQFWLTLRREAHQELGADAVRHGNGVLADVHLGQLIKIEGESNAPDRYLGRHIVIGTAVQSGERSSIEFGITPVVDMVDGQSPLDGCVKERPIVYGINEHQGGL